MEIMISCLEFLRSSFVHFLNNFLGGITPKFIVLLDFILAHFIMHIMLSAKLKQLLPLKNHITFFQKRIACIIIIGVAQSIDALTGVDAIHSIITYYFIALEGTYIINIAQELGLPIPEQLTTGIKHFGNYQSKSTNKKHAAFLPHNDKKET